MLNILNSLLFISAFIVAKPLLAAECFNGKLRYIAFFKVQIIQAKYCTNRDRTALYSLSCKNKNCDAFKQIFTINEDALYSEVGKPGFRLCREVGGDPQIIEFSANKKWYKLDRCLFTSDDSFVDTGTLLDFYLN